MTLKAMGNQAARREGQGAEDGCEVTDNVLVLDQMVHL